MLEQVIKAEAGLCFTASFLLAINQRFIAGIVSLMALAFLLLTQDNPCIKKYLTPGQISSNSNLTSIHLALMGCTLFLMQVQSVKRTASCKLN